jgi:uncharacterized membrane protein YqaE (UPF0057 family)
MFSKNHLQTIRLTISALFPPVAVCYKRSAVQASTIFADDQPV